MLMRLLFFIMPSCVVVFELLNAYIITGFVLMLTRAKSLQAPFSSLIIKIFSIVYNLSSLCRSGAVCLHLLLLAAYGDQK